MKRLLLVLVLLLAPSVAFAVVTTKFALTNAGWTDLGVGPLQLSFTGNAIYAISDTTPSLVSEGMVLANGDSSPIGTNSHVWAMAAGNAGATAYVAPVTSGGGGGGGAVSGASGSFVDCWSTTHGCTTDAAWSGSGAGSLVAIDKKIAALLTGAIPAQSTDGVNIGGTQPIASTLGGATPYGIIAAATNNSTLISAGVHTVYSVQLANISAAPAYLKFYDKATAPTCGTDTPKATLIIPAAATAALGGGSNVSVPVGKAFALGLGFCVVTGMAVTDNISIAATNTIAINIDYK